MRISDWSSDVCSSDLEQMQVVRFAVQGKAYEAFAVRTPDITGALRKAVTEYEICMIRPYGLQDRAIIMSLEEIWVPGGLVHFPDDLCPDRKSTRLNSSH